MKILINLEDLPKYRAHQGVLCECEYCQNPFEVAKNTVMRFLNSHNGTDPTAKFKGKFCSRECYLKANQKKEYPCVLCGKNVKKFPKEIKNNIFCTSSCAATYNNTHKTKGTRRSKLEKWLEEQLTILYPNLEILYSHKAAINSELDVYIPSLNLAFELNGLFHYEPIFGPEKLAQIQNNDNRKFQACLEKGIQLCIIDTSQHKYVKPATSQKYLDIIIKIIDSNLNGATDKNRTCKISQ